MIKRFLTVVGSVGLFAGLAALPGAVITAGEDPGVSDDPHGSCAANPCW